MSELFDDLSPMFDAVAQSEEPMHICPVCSKLLRNAHSGVASHLNVHFKAGEIDKDEIEEFKKSALGYRKKYRYRRKAGKDA